MAAIRERAKKFQRFVKGLKDKYPQALADNNKPLLDRFIFYLLFYSNPVTYARKAHRTFTDEKVFASWSEVRVSTVREITQVLEESKIKPADFLAPRLKELLQRVFEEVDDVALEPLVEPIQEAETAKSRKDAIERVRRFVADLPGIPPWGATYLLTGLGLENHIPWDPYTETVLESFKAFPAKATLTQKKRVMKALLDGLEELTLLDVHHLLVEAGKRDLKRK